MEYERIANWIRENDAGPDMYGRGAFLNGFEGKVAALLGFESAVFMPSGTMAQQIALRIWTDRAGCRHAAMHPTSHLELHEHRAVQHIHNLQVTLLGSRLRPTTAADLESVKERTAALLVELPLREIGGQLPSWEELEALKKAAAARNVRLHLDGARLWETRAAYGRDYAGICRGFDSTYVSFYKGIGGLGGAMLLGPSSFIEEARIWVRRHGGNLFQLHPIAASAALHFDERLEKMPRFFERAKALAEAFRDVEGVSVNPDPPHVNMMHVHVNAPADVMKAARNRVAEEDRIWLFNGAHPLDVPGWSYFEVYVGENALALDPNDAAAAMGRLVRFARNRSR